MTIREIFATNLRRARVNCKLTQEALAHEAQIDRTYVSALERGLYSVSLDTIQQIADALGVEPHMLLTPVADTGDHDRDATG
jgi:transcriptional regulator with XRE-family HTH domain